MAIKYINSINKDGQIYKLKSVAFDYLGPSKNTTLFGNAQIPSNNSINNSFLFNNTQKSTGLQYITTGLYNSTDNAYIYGIGGGVDDNSRNNLVEFNNDGIRVRVNNGSSYEMKKLSSLGSTTKGSDLASVLTDGLLLLKNKTNESWVNSVPEEIKSDLIYKFSFKECTINNIPYILVNKTRRS